MSKIACEIVLGDILKKPNLVIGLPTGRTPLGLYRNLVWVYKKRKISFSRIKFFNVDEYYPIKKRDQNSFYHYLSKNLFNKVNATASNIHLLNGETKNPKRECADYGRKIRENLLDLLILGVGVNSHIGFNEPCSSFNSRTRLVELSEETIKRNSRFFKNKKIPPKALTMGIKTMMSAKKIILLASGKEKHSALKHLINGSVNEKFPVSILKRHKNLIVVADKKALGRG